MWWLLGIGVIALLFGTHANDSSAQPVTHSGPAPLPPLTPGIMSPPYQFVPGVMYHLSLGMADGTGSVKPTLTDAEADLEHSGFHIVTLAGGPSPVPGMSGFLARVIPTVPVEDDGVPGVSPTGLHTLMYDVSIADNTEQQASADQGMLGGLAGLGGLLGA